MSKYRLNLIDALQQDENYKISTEKSIKKSKSKRIIRILAIGLIAIFLLFTRGIVTEQSLIQEVPKLSFWTGIARTLIFQEHLLNGEMSDRVNILIMGMSGGDNDGAYLTDTMVLASFKPSTNEIALLSFPRDLWVPIPGYGWAKINYANAFGELNNNGRGSELATQVISQLTDLPIQYFIRIDFNGFKEIIDALDGIEINVENSFIDAEYPGPNFTYRTISFQKGLEKMDGARVLEYVRSRHGTNGEGSDFARSKRQQQVIVAVKNKLEQINIFGNPQKAWIVFNLMKKYFETNLSFDELISLSQKLKLFDQGKIINKTLDLSDGSPLYSEMYNGAYILKTKTGDFSQISEIAKDIFNQNQITENAETNVTKAKIAILNGTYLEGLARAKADLLIDQFNVIEIGNAAQRGYEQTIIYDLSKDQKKEQLDQLKKIINGLTVSKNIPSEITYYQADFVIVLGEK
jgi:polyisoprenyl-teichoic acid--peptidoglycan teichoic acid transferase